MKKEKILGIIGVLLLSAIIRIGITTYTREKNIRDVEKLQEAFKKIEFRSGDVKGYNGFMTYDGQNMSVAIEDYLSNSNLLVSSYKDYSNIIDSKHKIEKIAKANEFYK